jgi:hypothetical protein
MVGFDCRDALVVTGGDGHLCRLPLGNRRCDHSGQTSSNGLQGYRKTDKWFRAARHLVNGLRTRRSTID